MAPDTDLRSTTALLDRWVWDERAAEALAKTGNRASSLLLVDLDSLPAIIDRHGQSAGNAVRQAAVSILANATRDTDVLGHYGHGGDEFLVLLPARDRQLGELIARRVRSRIRRAIIPVPARLPTSIGIAITDPTTARTLTLPELIHQADAALLAARDRGGDHIVTAGTRP